MLAPSSIPITLIRYALGMTMMAYGLIKILQIQFVLPAEVFDYRLGDLDGVTLTWAFLGYSPGFSILLGFFELVPGFMLLFRKIFLTGAILLLPSTLAVTMINNAFEFLPHMRIFSGALLILNVLLLLSHYKMLSEFFRRALEYCTVAKLEIVINTVLLGVLAFAIFYFLV